MDFKVAGTKEFVTAIQLDTKLDGIPADVLAGALTQAREARLHILDVMNEAIDAPDEMSAYAPRVITVQVPVDKIGEVIGPKGKMINQIQDDTGAHISIEDDGTVYIGATDGPSAEAARADDQRDRQPADARGRRALPGHRREDDDLRRLRLPAARQGRPAAHLRGAQARRWQADRRTSRTSCLKVGQKVQVELKEIDPRGKLSLAAVLPEGSRGPQRALRCRLRTSRSRAARRRSSLRSDRPSRTSSTAWTRSAPSAPCVGRSPDRATSTQRPWRRWTPPATRRPGAAPGLAGAWIRLIVVIDDARSTLRSSPTAGTRCGPTTSPEP
jgi:polyribonucleotide nucleotidyltransferase